MVTVFTGGYPPPHLVKRLFIFSDRFNNQTWWERVGADSPQSQLASEWLDTAQQLRSLISGCFDNIPGKSFLHHLITKSGKYTDCFH